MKVKIFNSKNSTDELENMIAEWTKDLAPVIHNVNITLNPYTDYTDDGRIYIRWVEYMASIIYNLKK